ncbi:hypothetical protein GCM10023314_07650 [Algibacter agarivorans]|uniref:Uncharacterized protein n=1 Tax=Algibacter agarivorans TaxID=1109741 RepID=A0ABP9GD61_9FLAO
MSHINRFFFAYFLLKIFTVTKAMLRILISVNQKIIQFLNTTLYIQIDIRAVNPKTY